MLGQRDPMTGNRSVLSEALPRRNRSCPDSRLALFVLNWSCIFCLEDLQEGWLGRTNASMGYAICFLLRLLLLSAVIKPITAEVYGNLSLGIFCRDH